MADIILPDHDQPPTTIQSSDSIKDKGLGARIFNAAMSLKWKEVVDLFKSNKPVRYEKITRNNDTVLHVAISGATQNIVSQLLEIVESTNTLGIYIYIYCLLWSVISMVSCSCSGFIMYMHVESTFIK